MVSDPTAPRAFCHSYLVSFTTCTRVHLVRAACILRRKFGRKVWKIATDIPQNCKHRMRKVARVSLRARENCRVKRAHSYKWGRV